MKRIIKISLLLVLVAVLVSQSSILANIFSPHTAYAVGDLQVDWGVPEGEPIFTLSNFAPGNTETHTVHVHNGSSEKQTVSLRGILTNDPGNLANVLQIVITKDSTDIYGGSSGQKTLSQFFIDTTLPNFIPLTTLNPNKDASYTITVLFPQTAGNRFQNQSVTFDLKIGIGITTPTVCQNMQLTNVIYGKEKSETINGTNGNDLIYGIGGSDHINGNGGNDCIIGGTGSDTISGGAGNDALFGEGGSDRIQGDAGDDTLDGGVGSDTLAGGTGNDSITGGGAFDDANGNAGYDICNAEKKINCEQ